MQMPKHVFNDSCTLENLQGNSAYGEVFGSKKTVKCRIEPKRSKVYSATGQDTISNAQAVMPSGTIIDAGDRVTYKGREYRVIDAIPVTAQTSKIHHWSVFLS